MQIYKKICVTCCAIFAAATLWAQDTLSEELQQQVNQIAATIDSNPSAAMKQFDDLTKGKNKKNSALAVAIGKVYLERDEIDKASAYSEKAKAINRKSAIVNLLAGDVALKKKNIGEAGSYYEQAIMFDKDCSEAYYKFARLYLNVNPQLSVEKLLEYKERHPEDLDLYRELGNAYYLIGKYSDAKSAYDNFMTSGEPNAQDYARYSNLLFLSKDYAGSMDMAQKGLQMNPDDHLLKRLLMYDNYELGHFSDGVEAANNFFAVDDTSNFVYLDYLYYGRLLLSQKQDNLAIEQFKKAESMDPDGQYPEIVKELSSVFEGLQNYPEAISYYERFLDLSGTEDVSNLFMLGRLYYMAASADDSVYDDSPADTTATGISLRKANYIERADTIFAEVALKAPDSYLGMFWRARANSLADPETTLGYAKPYYEASLAILESNPNSAKANIVECLKYLGYYYFVQEDLDQSKSYWERVLQITPNDAAALQVLEFINAAQK